ncbi:MAG: divergent PAP2 family protein [Candidatus Woesearchaeota archaeon]
MKEILYQMFTDKVFISLIATLILSEIIKNSISLYKNKKFIFSKLYEGGGMPSTHSSLVTSLTASILLNNGFSLLFIVVSVFSIIVIRDSFGVRKYVGEHAKILNNMLKDQKLSKSIKSNKKLQENIGHKPIEVIAGIILGIIVSIIVWLI